MSEIPPSWVKKVAGDEPAIQKSVASEVGELLKDVPHTARDSVRTFFSPLNALARTVRNTFRGL